MTRGERAQGVILLLAGPVYLFSVAVTPPGFVNSASTERPADPRVEFDVPVTATDQVGGSARNSPIVVADPTDPDVLVTAARIDARAYGCELDISTDGGRSWVGRRLIRQLPPGAASCYAPQVAFDGSGRLHLVFAGLQEAGNVPMGVFHVRSDNQGRSFTEPHRIIGASAFGVRMAIDTAFGDHGRIHLVWLQAGADPGVGALPSVPNPIVASYSDDGGETFGEPVPVSTPDRRRVVAPAVRVGAEGRVDVVYYDLGDDERDYQGLDGPVWDGTWSLVLAASDDGGATFSERSVVEDSVVPAERVQLIFTMPPASMARSHDGTLYVAWHDARNGDADVFVRRSTDGGSSWSTPRQVNDDAPDSLTDQYHPVVSVAPSGRLDVAFYDRRHDRNNVYNDVYYAYSLDQGATFSANLRLNRTSSNSKVGQRYELDHARGMVEFGAHPSLLSYDDRMVAAWTDTRHADVLNVTRFRGPTEQDIFATTVNFGSPGR